MPNGKTIITFAALYVACRAVESTAANFGYDWTRILPTRTAVAGLTSGASTSSAGAALPVMS